MYMTSYARVFLALSLLFSSSLLAQSRFTGTWEGPVSDQNENETKYRIKFNGTESPDIFYYDDSRGNYVSVRDDSRLPGYRVRTRMEQSNKAAVLTLIREKGSESRVETFLFSEIYADSLVVMWMFMDSPWSEESVGGGGGYLARVDRGATSFSGSRISVGGQSYSYIRIESIEPRPDRTVVRFVITNEKSTNQGGTFHEPGSPTAFYITNADRSRKYKLIGSSVSLPYTMTVAPGQTLRIALEFEPIPSSMKLLNIFEGGEGENLWKFFDVRLKD